MSEHETKHEHEINEELGYETQEILRRTPAIIFSASLVMLVVATILLTLWILNTEENRRQPSASRPELRKARIFRARKTFGKQFWMDR